MNLKSRISKLEDGAGGPCERSATVGRLTVDLDMDKVRSRPNDRKVPLPKEAKEILRLLESGSEGAKCPA